MVTIKVNKNDGNQRIDKFLLKTFKNLPVSLMYKYIRTKRIKVNSKRCSISTRVNESDTITLYISDDLLKEKEGAYSFLNAPDDINIVYEDSNILLVNKNPGLIVHSEDNEGLDTLIDRIKHHLYNKGEYNPDMENSFVPALVNRIDRNTSGIVIAAKNADSLRILNEKMKEREIKKNYLCLVAGVLNKKENTLIDFLEKNESQNRVYVLKEPTLNTRTIKTKYKVLKEKKLCDTMYASLLEVELLTGRTHQIRAHLSSIGHPILGDGKYGTNEINKRVGYRYQALCSYKLEFVFKTDAGNLNYLNGKCFMLDDIWFLRDY